MTVSSPGDPAFKQAVDGELKSMMASGEMAKHYDKWFVQPIPPRNVGLNLPLSDELKALFAKPNDQRAQATRAGETQNVRITKVPQVGADARAP